MPPLWVSQNQFSKSPSVLMRSSVHLRTLWLRLDMRDSKRPLVSDNIQYSDTDLSMQHALTARTIPETVRVIYNDENLKRG